MDTQCHACIGGTSVRDGISKLEQGQHVVVGTPGRVFDMINRNALSKYISNIFLRSILYLMMGVRPPAHRSNTTG